MADIRIRDLIGSEPEEVVGGNFIPVSLDPSSDLPQVTRKATFDQVISGGAPQYSGEFLSGNFTALTIGLEQVVTSTAGAGGGIEFGDPSEPDNPDAQPSLAIDPDNGGVNISKDLDVGGSMNVSGPITVTKQDVEGNDISCSVIDQCMIGQGLTFEDNVLKANLGGAPAGGGGMEIDPDDGSIKFPNVDNPGAPSPFEIDSTGQIVVNGNSGVRKLFIDYFVHIYFDVDNASSADNKVEKFLTYPKLQRQYDNGILVGWEESLGSFLEKLVPSGVPAWFEWPGVGWVIAPAPNADWVNLTNTLFSMKDWLYFNTTSSELRSVSDTSTRVVFSGWFWHDGYQVWIFMIDLEGATNIDGIINSNWCYVAGFRQGEALAAGWGYWEPGSGMSNLYLQSKEKYFTAAEFKQAGFTGTNGNPPPARDPNADTPEGLPDLIPIR